MATCPNYFKEHSLADTPSLKLVGSSIIPESLLKGEQIVRLDDIPCLTTTRNELWCECFACLNRLALEVRASELQLTACTFLTPCNLQPTICTTLSISTEGMVRQRCGEERAIADK